MYLFLLFRLCIVLLFLAVFVFETTISGERRPLTACISNKLRGPLSLFLYLGKFHNVLSKCMDTVQKMHFFFIPLPDHFC